MLNIIMFGPPGSGKGTQSKKITEQFGFKHLSTGDMLRFEMDQKTELGEKIRTGMDNGEYVSDKLAIQLIKKSIQKNRDKEGFVFDGFPRTKDQAKALDILLEEMHYDISILLALKVPESVLIKRLNERAKISGRGEDQGVEVIKKRLGIYNSKTKPVMDYYKAKNKLRLISGVGSVDDIFYHIHEEIVSLKIK
ncbi:MAG: adenylate kinase [Bacteroidetes bacterium]|nr:MAG: adenylate kinase [Bacteroidota bacterium]